MPTQKPTKRNHHYRPVLHLRHFADSSGRLWVYGRGQELPFRQRPERIGYEKFLYAPGDGPNPQDDAFEDWLMANVDGPSAHIFNRLVSDAYPSGPSGVQPPRADRGVFARFVGIQDMRTPRARDFIMDGIQQALERSYQNWTRNPEELRRSIYRDTGTLYTAEELHHHIVTHDVVASKGFWFEYMMDTIHIAGERIFKMRWHVVDAPSGCSFVTGDIGIAKFCLGVDQPCNWRMGFHLGATHWVMPLNPFRALVLVPAEDPRTLPAPTVEWVQIVNERLVRDAWRFVYCQTPAPLIPELWRAYPEPTPDVWPGWMLPPLDGDKA